METIGLAKSSGPQCDAGLDAGSRRQRNGRGANRTTSAPATPWRRRSSPLAGDCIHHMASKYVRAKVTALHQRHQDQSEEHEKGATKTTPRTRSAGEHTLVGAEVNFVEAALHQDELPRQARASPNVWPLPTREAQRQTTVGGDDMEVERRKDDRMDDEVHEHLDPRTSTAWSCDTNPADRRTDVTHAPRPR